MCLNLVLVKISVWRPHREGFFIQAMLISWGNSHFHSTASKTRFMSPTKGESAYWSVPPASNPAAGKWSDHCEPGSDGGTETSAIYHPGLRTTKGQVSKSRDFLVPKITCNMRRIKSAAEKQCAPAHLCISVTYSLKLAPSEWSPN